MDFAWSAEQIRFKNEVHDFAETLLKDEVDRDKRSEFADLHWQSCAKFGIQGMAVPECFGGTGRADILTGMLAMEAMGQACADMGLLFALNTQMWTVQLPILKFGTEEQKSKFLPGLCRGELLGAHAMTEPNSGSDAFSLQTTAERCDGGYRLNGTKRLVTLAPIADVVIVFATVNPSLGKWGVTAFLVERESLGYRVSPTMEKMGLRTVPIGEIYLENCIVPECNRLGGEVRRILIVAALAGVRTLLHSGQPSWCNGPSVVRCNRVCKKTTTIWPTDWKIPGGVEPNRRDENASRNRPAAALQSCVAQTTRPAGDARSGNAKVVLE